jgi:hypothetical protein
VVDTVRVCYIQYSTCRGTVDHATCPRVYEKISFYMSRKYICSGRGMAYENVLGVKLERRSGRLSSFERPERAHSDLVEPMKTGDCRCFARASISPTYGVVGVQARLRRAVVCLSTSSRVLLFCLVIRLLCAASSCIALPGQARWESLLQLCSASRRNQRKAQLY